MSNLTETINEFMTPRLFERVSAASGLPDSKVRVGMNGAVASILDGLVTKAHDPHAMGQLAELARTIPASQTPEHMLDDEVAVQRTSDHLMGVVGGDSQGMTARVGRFVGVGGKAASGMVAAAAAVIVGALRKLAMSPSGLDPNALSSRLIDEGRAIHASVPPGMLATDQARVAATRGERVVVAGPRGAIERTPRAADRPHATTSRPWWVLGLLALAALLGVIWMAGRARRASAPAVHTPSATERNTVVPTAPTPERAPATAPQREQARTPGTAGTAALTFPAGTPEAQLLDEIRSPGAIGESKQIELENAFAPGESTLQAQASDKVANIGSVLAAYPSARIKITGFAEQNAETPNPAQAQQRADAVREALIARGIDASRIETSSAEANPSGEPGSTKQVSDGVAIQVTSR